MMQDGLNIEKLLGQVNKDKYHKATIGEVKHIPQVKLEHLSPKQALDDYILINHEVIRSNLELCYKIVKKSQSWSDPTKPSVPFPRELVNAFDALLAGSEFPSERVEYYTAVKPHTIEAHNKSEEMNLNRTHLDAIGIDAFFEIVVDEDEENGKKKIVRIPFDLTLRDKFDEKKANKDKNIFIMIISDDLDYDMAQAGTLKSMTKEDCIKKHVNPQAEKLLKIFEQASKSNKFDII